MLYFNIALPTRLLMTAYHCEYHMHDSSSFFCRSADLYLGAEDIEMGASNNKPSKPLLELTSIKDSFVYGTVYLYYIAISVIVCIHQPLTLQLRKSIQITENVIEPCFLFFEDTGPNVLCIHLIGHLCVFLPV